MFIVNGLSNAWQILKDPNEKEFTVCNYDNTVRLAVHDPDFESKLQDLPVGDESNKQIVNKDIYPDTGIAVRFDDKTVIPMVFAADNRKDTILGAISIALKPSYRITSVYNEGVRIYSRIFDRNNRVEFIGNFSKSKRDDIYPRITITAISDEKSSMVQYEVGYNESTKKVVVQMIQHTFRSNPRRNEPGHINTRDYVQKTLENGREVLPLFYQSSPSAAIMVQPDDVDMLHDIVDSKTNWKQWHRYHVVQGVTEENLRKLAEDGYRAVTIFTDTHIDPKTFYNEDWREVMYGIGELAVKLFDIVYLIGNNALVYKLKVGDVIRSAK